MEWKNAFKIVDFILPGETVLVEYTTSYIPEFLLEFFVEYSRERGTSLLIDDDFDALHTLVTHAKFLEMEVDLSDVYVLKTGGKIELGNVVARVPFHPDPRVYLKNYEETSKEAFDSIPTPMINLVLGLENIFLLMKTPLDFYRIVLSMQRFMGDKRRKAFYVVNREVMESLPLAVLPELERISTTVMRLTPYHTGATIEVVKSVNPKLVGMKMNVDAGRWRE
jgi:hypothetical protein